MTTLRVLAYNVQSLRGSPADVVAVIRAVDPDVVCVQEAPRFLFSKRKARWLARRSGLRVAARGWRAREVVVLSRPALDLAGASVTAFRWRPPRHRRGFARATFLVGGRRVTVGSFHLGLDPAERLEHAAAIASYAREAGGALVAGGDVNETPGQPSWQLLETAGADAFGVAPAGPGETYPARAPRRRIDAIFVGEAAGRVVACEVVSDPRVGVASDHRPVLATITVA